MTRVLMAMLFAAGLASPALAQVDCATEVNDVRAALETAGVPDEQRAEIDAALTQAEQLAMQGNEEGCAAIVAEVRAEAGL